jgi:hypothetical protein
MRIRFYGAIATATAVLAMMALASMPASSQGRGKGGPQAPTGPAPKTLEGKPDFSGLWQRPYTPDMTKDARDGSQKGMAKLPFTPWGLDQWKSYDADKGDYTGACLPFGLIRSMNSPDPIQVMQNPKYLALLYEQNTWFHIIPIGRPHNKDLVATWFGDSVGKWEGDTLVVDTDNFNGKTKLDTIGHPMSDQLHVVERFTRTDLGHIAYEISIDDSKTYTKPWKNTRTFTLRPDWEIMEYSCEENNKGFWEGRIKVPAFAK